MRRHARYLVEHGAEPHAQRRAAECARQNADQRDADLHGRQEAAGIVGQRQGLRGAAFACLRHLLQPNAAGRHHRHLGHGKKAIQQEQAEQDGNFERNFHDETVRTPRPGGHDARATFIADSRSGI